MELKACDLEKLLNLNRAEIEKLIAEKKLPAYLVDNEYRCNRSELKAWLLENNYKVSEEILNYEENPFSISLTALISRGGVFRNISGKTAFEVIKNAVNLLTLPYELSRDKLILSLLEREEMMTTAIGEGIALPHPRNPLLTDQANQSISICFLQQAIDFKALDRKPVHTLFVILSANSQNHLDILARVSFLCHQKEFIKLLQNRAPEKEIFDYIMLKEMEWNQNLKT